MKVVFLTESLGRGHAPPFGEAYSVRGSSCLFFDGKDFGVKSSYLKAVLEKRPSLVVLGTDADFVGTKIATIWNRELKERGIKTVRMPLTSKGYAFIGSLYDESQIKALSRISASNLSSYSYSKQVLGKGISTIKALQIKALNEAPEKFKTKKGTNTATFLTRALSKGISPQKAMGLLQRAYQSGKIVYPRVDNDYNLQGLDVYAHPPLTEGEFNSPYLKPYQEEVEKLSKATALLYLNQRGLLPPSSLERFYLTTNLSQEGRVRLSKEEEKVIEEIIEEEEKDFLSNFYLLFPQFTFKKVSLKEKRTEKNLIDALLEAQEEVERLEAERRKEKERREEKQSQSKCYKPYEREV